MKLVEILALGLDKWADTTVCYTQDGDGNTFPWTKEPALNGDDWETGGGHIDQSILARFPSPNMKASDWKTAIITRADWEAERARIKGETKVKPKANKDGWIRHRGGKCPVAIGDQIDVRYRNGNVKVRTADADDEANEVWMHVNDDDDIMAWRPHKTEPQIEPSVIANDRAEMPSAKYFDGPLQWRDRILELDTEQKAADDEHKAATEARDAERADLVAKLKAEGLALIQAQEDMSNPANWKVDDLVEIIGSTNDGWLRFKGMKGQLKYDGDWFVNFGRANEWYLSDNTDIKWHSRPAK